MGFLNNHQDAFMKSSSAWGDDNVTVYNLPNRDEVRSGLRTDNMGYGELEEMITQVSSIEPSNIEDENILNSKLETLNWEKEKRDELENVTRIERDDAFEPRDTIVKEDVVENPKPRPRPRPIPIPIPMPKPTPSLNEDIDTSLDDLDIELEDLISDDISVPQVSSNMDDDTNTFLMAALIIIVVVKIID